MTSERTEEVGHKGHPGDPRGESDDLVFKVGAEHVGVS